MNAHPMQSIEASGSAPPVQVGAPKVDVLDVLTRIAVTNAAFATTADRDGIVRFTESMLVRQAGDLRDVRGAVAELIEANRRVSSHLEKAIEFIEKAYPDARQLDRGPIMRNMRRWRDRLQVAAARIGGAA